MKKCYLSENISIYRKERSMTQSDLAQQLGVSHQAVSLWERGETLPDIALLPQLAEVLKTSVEALFQEPPFQQRASIKEPGEEKERQAQPKTEGGQQTSAEKDPGQAPSFYAFVQEQVRQAVQAAVDLEKEGKNAFSRFPFPDDGAIRAALFIGSRLCSSQEVKKILGGRKALLALEAEAVQAPVYSQLSIECGDIAGPVSCGGDLNCGDIAGGVSAGGDVECGDVEGNVSAGGGVECGDIGGLVHSAGGPIHS